MTRLTFALDERRGVVTRLCAPGGMNLVGTPENTSYPSIRAAGPWLGDLVVQWWDGEGWRRETTAASDDVREVALADDARVAYRGRSMRPDGLSRIGVEQRWWQAGDAVRWAIELVNQGGEPVEIGEVALAFTMNTDYTGVFAGRPMRERAGGQLQRIWHEERLVQHLHIAGHGSYAVLQRPAGDTPLLLFAPCADTALEAAYQVDPSLGDQWSTTFDGPYFLASHSRAARHTQGWLRHRERQRPWLHGNTSLLLAPGASHRLEFRFVLLDAPEAIGDELVRGGQVAVDVVPGMAAPVGEAILLRLRGAPDARVVPEAGGVTVHEVGPDRFRLDLATVGQKPVLVRYDQERWTRLLFYATGRPASLLRARASFIVAEQQYDNPQDPFGRHLAFLAYDDQRQSLLLDSEEAWQVGGSDEYGLPIAMFLARRNVDDPRPDQVAALERYIDGFLLRALQDPDTLRIRRGMYWTPPLPSRRGHEWSEPESLTTDRAMNYPLVANLHHAMYRIARLHGLTRTRGAAEYLSLAWRTAVLGFEIGNLASTGAPAGANLVNLLDDLAAEDPEGHAALDAHLRRFAETTAADPYPFGSELFIDQTAHAQVFAALHRYGFDAQAQRAVRVTRALRAGAQPSWFRYGNDQRGSVCCWYGTAQNSGVLLAGFERTGDPSLLKLAYGGLTSFLTTVRETGQARGWFTWWPDRPGFDSRSLDTDMGLYAYLLAAKAYVVEEEPFGLVGYGCRVEAQADGAIVATPWDGAGKRLRIVPAGIDVTVVKGELRRVSLSADRAALRIELADPSARLDALDLEVAGLALAGGSATVGGEARPLQSADGRVSIRGPGLDRGATLEIVAAR